MLKELMFLELAISEEEPVEESSIDDVNTETGEEGLEVDTKEPEETPVSEFDIDGEKYSLEQIKEWKLGSMRQQDYTKKTQELSTLRKEANDALELYNYMKEHPEVAKKLAELEDTSQGVKQTANRASDPAYRQIEDLNIQVKTMQINADLAEITANDKSVNDLELLEIAKNSNTDIKTAYAIWKGNNLDKIINERLKNQSKEITEKIKTNKKQTQTIIKPGDKETPSGDFGLSDAELDYAKKLGMSPEEYKKWSV